jgi:hypothetical protein
METHAEHILTSRALPNCAGPSDGKHISIKCFPETGSLCFNYKGYFSTSLPLDDSCETLPHYLVAAQAFPLKINLMRPYSGRMPTNKRHTFNYKLSHARKRVECAFVIQNAKFKISEGQLCCKETVNSIVKASVVLHNFIRTQEGLFCE